MSKPVTRLASEMATKEQKKKRGFLSFLDDNITGGLVKVGDFFADGGNALADMAKNPLDTAKEMGSMAKQTFFDPVWNMPKAFDPTSGLSPMERVNTGLGGGLALADAVTPFLPEGALANAIVQRAANRTLAETGQRSFEYGLHHSLTPGIKTINPSRKGFQVTALDAKPGSTYFWQGEGRDMSTGVHSAMDNLQRAIYRRQNQIAEAPEFYQGTPRTYITRVPKEGILPDENVLGSRARRIEQPLRVVSEIDPMMGYENMSSRLRKYGLGMQNYPEAQYARNVSGIAEELANLKAMRDSAAKWQSNPGPALPEPPPINLSGRSNVTYTPEQLEILRKARERG